MGKLTNFDIFLNNPSRVYYAGQNLDGTVIVDLNDAMKMRGKHFSIFLKQLYDTCMFCLQHLSICPTIMSNWIRIWRYTLLLLLPLSAHCHLVDYSVTVIWLTILSLSFGWLFCHCIWCALAYSKCQQVTNEVCAVSPSSRFSTV